MPYAPATRYDASPLYQGLADAGRYIYQGRESALDRELRAKQLALAYGQHADDLALGYYRVGEDARQHDNQVANQGVIENARLGERAADRKQELDITKAKMRNQSIAYAVTDEEGKPIPGTYSINGQVVRPAAKKDSNAKPETHVDPVSKRTFYRSAPDAPWKPMTDGSSGVGALLGGAVDPTQKRIGELQADISRGLGDQVSGFDLPGETRKQALQRLQGGEAPAPAKSAPAQTSAPAGSPPTVTTKAEWDALPSGTRYRTKDGRMAQKP